MIFLNRPFGCQKHHFKPQKGVCFSYISKIVKRLPWSDPAAIGALETRNTYFLATHAGAELDLLIMARGKRFGFELKYADAPARRRSILIALEDLHLAHLWVVYPGDQAYDLDDRISVIPMADLTRLPSLIG